MGTSASSKGPESGVSFDPPWLGEEGEFIFPEEGDGPSDQKESPEIAPPKRFLQAKTKIGKYSREGLGRSGFEKAAGHYSRTGMGGAANLARRMRHSTATGARLTEFLTSTTSRSNESVNKWLSDIVSRDLSQRELIDAIIQHVAPSGGSRDEESSADSMSSALSEYLEDHPDSNLLELDEEEVRDITERFIANEACNRMANDIGQFLEDGRLTLSESLSTLNEMREFLVADLAGAMESLWESNPNPSQAQLSQILETAIRRTFEIYEGEI